MLTNTISWFWIDFALTSLKLFWPLQLFLKVHYEHLIIYPTFINDSSTIRQLLIWSDKHLLMICWKVFFSPNKCHIIDYRVNDFSDFMLNTFDRFTKNLSTVVHSESFSFYISSFRLSFGVSYLYFINTVYTCPSIKLKITF
jgi:hypothetical protein